MNAAGWGGGGAQEERESGREMKWEGESDKGIYMHVHQCVNYTVTVICRH